MLLIGVDGGGTKTAAWIGLCEQAKLHVVGQGESGPSNPKAVGYPEALNNLEAAIADAFRDARLNRQPAAAACLCIAGIANADEQHPLRDWLDAQAIAQRYELAMDVEAILAVAGGTELDGGIALIAGTGSIAWGRNAQRQTARCGGWGYLLGDEGSGYAIALDALRMACRSADGRSVDSRLLHAFMQELQVEDSRQLIQRVYDPSTSRSQLAALSRLVFELSDSDAAAAKVIDSAAGQLAEMVSVTARKLRLPEKDFLLAMAGGNLVHQPAYRASVLAKLTVEYALHPRSLTVEHPVAGALRLAKDLADK